MTSETKYRSRASLPRPEIVDLAETHRLTLEAESFESAGKYRLATCIVRRNGPATNQIAEQGDRRIVS
jgi:hypothetical protein